MASTRILLIEDNPGDVVLTRHLLHVGAPGQVRLNCANSLEAAIELIHESEFDVALLDLAVPGYFGLAALHQLLEFAPNLPIVVFSGEDSEELALRSVAEGAQDFLHKRHIDGRHLVLAVRSAILRKQAELELARRASHDDLTGLPTRALLHDRWDRARRRQGRSGAWMGVLVVDLDGFKGINDSYGHLAGDFVLQVVAHRCRGALRSGDTIARFGGDEFVVLLEEIRGVEDAKQIAQKISLAIEPPIEHDGVSIAPHASIGIAICHPDQPDSLEDAIRRADLSMYRCKNGAARPRLAVPLHDTEDRRPADSFAFSLD